MWERITKHGIAKNLEEKSLERASPLIIKYLYLAYSQIMLGPDSFLFQFQVCLLYCLNLCILRFFPFLVLVTLIYFCILTATIYYFIILFLVLFVRDQSKSNFFSLQYTNSYLNIKRECWNRIRTINSSYKFYKSGSIRLDWRELIHRKE